MEDATANSGSAFEGGNGMTVEQCQKAIQKSFKLPMVKFLREKLEKAGCSAKDSFFQAMICKRKTSGTYQRGHGIRVCSNHMIYQDEINQVIIHELIHAYDDCRVKNLLWTNCAHLACAEIRAAHLSGDCFFKRELLRGYTKLRGHEQDCVRRRVLMSMSESPYCTEASSKDAMEAVWDTCYNDTKPFDRAP
ncbi:Mitochondrial inner membrane protease ATP23 [Zostera marina]|uniref:Mitochondrial inner membrane protease ATP23 n=1 Tax=Zostera marina TaxID=29655 RepID=A0A0K9PP67_ZOSMR|nr:Mitochondrial inner membrane protease ATP23 [Zostera marina]